MPIETDIRGARTDVAFGPLTLIGQHIRLEPLQVSHVDALLEPALDQRIWEFTTARIRTLDDMRKYVDTALEWQRAGACVPFVIVDNESGAVIGSTRFENYDAAGRRVEIGWSWLNPRWWRTPINTEAKYLMLRHAFGQWRLVRVEFKTWVKNQRSRDAILRLGATEEGILRRRMVQPDGSFRDAVFYSIVDDEWPDVKQRLESKLHMHA